VKETPAPLFLTWLNNLSSPDAGGTGSEGFVDAIDYRPYAAQVRVPATATHVVSMTDAIAVFRTFTANLAGARHINTSEKQ
jgi:hypothetical protein